MTKQVQLRRGTTVQQSTFTGALGELTVDTTKMTLVLHDGTTAGGIEFARRDNVTEEVTMSMGMMAAMGWQNPKHFQEMTNII